MPGTTSHWDAAGYGLIGKPDGAQGFWRFLLRTLSLKGGQIVGSQRKAVGGR